MDNSKFDKLYIHEILINRQKFIILLNNQTHSKYQQQSNLNPFIMNQKTIILQPTKQLHHIYPDIQAQLCSRHSTLFGKLKTTFNKLYDNMQPTYYVIVKGNCQFVQQQFTELRLSMALQNGVIILVSKTYPQSQIFINSNHFSQQVIFSHTGQLQQGLNTMSSQISSVIKTATCNLNSNQLNGAILYIHSNVPQNQFNYQQSLYISLYLALMSINDNLKNFSTRQMIQKLSSLGFAGSKQQIQRIFQGYHNRKFNLTLPDLLSMKDRSLNPISLQGKIINKNEGNIQMMSQQQQQRLKQQNKINESNKIIQKSQLLLDMNKDYKFLFCKLDLAKQDVNYQFQRRKQIQIRKQQLLQQLNHMYSINGLFQLFHKLQQIPLQNIQFKSQYQKSYMPKSMEQLQCVDNNQILKQPINFLKALLMEIQLVSNFSNQKLSLQQLVNQIWKINSKALKLHSDQVVQLVQDMKQALQIQGCMVVNQDFLMIVVHKNKFTQLLCQVKHKMNKGQLKSKSLFKIQDQQLVVQRWSSDKAIGQKIFSSVPSQGVGIFDPTDAIWFD